MAREIPGLPRGGLSDTVSARLETLEFAIARLDKARLRVGDGINLTGQTGSISTTVILTNADAGWYEVHVYHECTTAGGADRSLATTIGYTDDVGATTIKPTTDLSMAATGRQPVTATPNDSCMFYHASGNITYATTVSGVLGSPQYALRIALERIAP